MRITKEKIGLVVGLAAFVTNPVTGQYVNQGVDWAFQQMFLYGYWVSLVAFGYFVGLMSLYMYQNREITKIPAKTTKTKTIGKLAQT